MNITLVVYEENERLSKILKLIRQVLGPAICADPRSFDGPFDKHDTIAIIFPLDNGRLPAAISAFVENHRPQLEAKKIALICVSDNRASGARVLKSAARKLPGTIVHTVRLPVSERQPTKTAGDKAMAFSETVDKMIALRRALLSPTDMPKELLWQEIEQILYAHNTCALCTGHSANGRVTPIEYLYKDGLLYFFSEGGEKFAHLYVNSRVYLAIFREYSGFSSLEGLQIEGIAETIDPDEEEYSVITDEKGLSPELLEKLPVKLNLFKVTPTRIEVLKSDFKKAGYAVKQVYIK